MNKMINIKESNQSAQGYPDIKASKTNWMYIVLYHKKFK